MKKLFSLVLMVWLLLACATEAPKETDASFIALSDLHFDPFYDPEIVKQLIDAEAPQWPEIFASSAQKALGNHSADSSGPLVLSSFEAVKKQADGAGFILFPGDFLAHDFEKYYAQYNGSMKGYEAFVTKTIEYLAGLFQEYFPGVPVLPALGNNDSFSGDYNIEAGGAFLKMFASRWEPFFTREADRASFKTTFPRGGYYSVDHPVLAGQKILVLNANFFSHKYSRGETPANLQFLWFKKALEESRQAGERLWLIYHEPPGVDVYSTLKSGDICAGKVTTMWKPSFNKKFIDLIIEYNEIIAMAFLGHTHMDDFRLIRRNKEAVSLGHIVPAVSPLFGNNPGFQLFTYNSGAGHITDYKTHYLSNLTTAESMDQAVWLPEYSYTAAYGQTGYSLQAASNVYGELDSKADMKESFISFYDLSAPPVAISSSQWPAYYSGTGNAAVKNFVDAYCGSAAE